jgi:hypothetical protein
MAGPPPFPHPEEKLSDIPLTLSGVCTIQKKKKLEKLPRSRPGEQLS